MSTDLRALAFSTLGVLKAMIVGLFRMYLQVNTFNVARHSCAPRNK